MDWEQRLSKLWQKIDDYNEKEFLKEMDNLVNELPDDNEIGLFERASAFDSTGHSGLAVQLYRKSLNKGLEGLRRRKAVIQLASSLRNIGNVEESIKLLRDEKFLNIEELNDEVNAFLALSLTDAGNEREAVSIILKSLSRHLKKYQKSVSNYANLLISE